MSRKNSYDLVFDRSPLQLADRKKANSSGELRSGDPCPKCGKGRLEYDGLLNLICPACGYAVVGCFT